MSEEHECSKCGRSFDSKRGLSVHKTQSHSEEETNSEASDGNTGVNVSLSTRTFGVLLLSLGFFIGLSTGLFIGSPGEVELSEQELAGLTEDVEGNGAAAGQDAGGNEITLVSELPYDVNIGTAEGSIEIGGDTVDVDGRPYMGNPDSDIKIMSFEDFFCPFCASFHNPEFAASQNANSAFPELMENHIETGEAQYFYSQFPVVGGEDPALASECAARESAESFFLFKENHFSNFEQLRELHSQDRSDYIDELVSWSDTIGVDEDEFRSCIENSETSGEVQDQASTGQSLGAEATPWIFINNQDVRGAQPYENLRTAIENVR